MSAAGVPVPEVPAPQSPEAPRAPQVESPRLKHLRQTAAESPRKALEDDAAAQEQADRAQNQEVLDSVFDTSLNVREGTDLESRGVDRRDQAAAGLDLVQDFKKGYEGLSLEAKSAVRGQMLRSLLQRPGGQDFIDAENASGTLNEALDEIANDPNFRQAVIDRRHELLEGPEVPDVSQYEEVAGSTDEQKIVLDTRIKEVDGRLREFSSSTVKFDAAGNAITEPGQKWKDMSEASEMMAEGKAGYDAQRAEFDEKLNAAGITEDQLRYSGIMLEDAITNGDRQTQDTITQLLDLRASLRNSSYLTAKGLYDSLMDEHSRLVQESTVLRNAKAGLDVKDAEGSLPGDSERRIDRANAEQEYADKINSIFGQALENTIDQGFDAAAEDAAARSETAAQNETDPMKQTLKRGNSEYWVAYRIDPETRKQVPIKDRVHDARAVEGRRVLMAENPAVVALNFTDPATGQRYTAEDISLAVEHWTTTADPGVRYLTEEAARSAGIGGQVELVQDNAFLAQFGTGGPDSLVRYLATNLQKPGTTENYTLAEVNAKFAEDPTFFNDIKKDAVEIVLLKAAAGKQITDEMVAKIRSADWAGKDYLDRILNNDEVKAAYEKKGFKMGSFADILKDKKKASLLIGFILLLGPLIGPAAMLAVGSKL